jgi:hypothetical protein
VQAPLRVEQIETRPSVSQGPAAVRQSWGSVPKHARRGETHQRRSQRVEHDYLTAVRQLISSRSDILPPVAPDRSQTPQRQGLHALTTAARCEPLPDLAVLQKKSSATMAQLAMPNCRETGGFGRSHSLSFDHRLRPDTLRTAIATAFFCPTRTTSFLPRVTPV